MAVPCALLQWFLECCWRSCLIVGCYLAVLVGCWLHFGSNASLLGVFGPVFWGFLLGFGDEFLPNFESDTDLLIKFWKNLIIGFFLGIFGGSLKLHSRLKSEKLVMMDFGIAMEKWVLAS